GREYSKDLIEVKGETGVIKVSGFCCAPFACRASRAGQYIYLNRRLVISKTIMAAAEQAYKNSVMVGKFPAFVLFADIPYEAVDVNVHPAKVEVRFADEKAVFSAVYAAVKAALAGSTARPQFPLENKNKGVFFANMDTGRFRQMAADIDSGDKKSDSGDEILRLKDDNVPFFLRKEFVKEVEKREEKTHSKQGFDSYKGAPSRKQSVDVNITAEPPEAKPEERNENPITDGVIFLGEAFKTYIIVQKGESIFILDKHACHERIIFNRLKAETVIESQPLLVPVSVHLSGEQYSAVLSSGETLLAAGIEVEDFGNETVIVRSVPAALSGDDVTDIITETAQNLSAGGSGEVSVIDDILHTVACKAATKAGYTSSKEELLTLAKQVLSSDDVLYCPHGRPVAFEIGRKELERRFGRIQ
ncbi:MAG: hypothetical protein J5662_04145, partial [Clostridia bacterium]|nr:hypothetical protein [Clostridia bacterium]